MNEATAKKLKRIQETSVFEMCEIQRELQKKLSVYADAIDKEFTERTGVRIDVITLSRWAPVNRQGPPSMVAKFEIVFKR